MRKIMCMVIAFWTVTASGSHIRGVDMWVSQTDSHTFEYNLRLYSKLSSTSADNPEIILEWGDGNVDTISRTMFTDFIVEDVRESVFIAYHTYTSYGDYTIHPQLTNWEHGILNMGSSESEPLVGEIEVKLWPFIMAGNTFNGWQNAQTFLYTGTGNFAIDLSFNEANGDSVVIVQQPVSQLAVGPQYTYPSGFGCTEYFIGTVYHCDNITIQGDYAVSFKFMEYKDGFFVASQLREFVFRYAPGMGVEEEQESSITLVFPNPVQVS
ncbi:MAG TPA: hypothetical protein VD905_18940 [Flavobacteriales bacterium]|nr:hypothetical protein [Flavobacteriales bacterium]